MALHQRVRSVLVDLLTEQAVLGALVATADGLIIDTLALAAEDAERLGAVSALLARQFLSRGERCGVVALDTGALAIGIGRQVLIVALLDSQHVTSVLTNSLLAAADQLDAAVAG